MSYEIRKIENASFKYPVCGGRCVKHGINKKGVQQIWCVDEQRAFTLGVNYVTSANS